MNVRRLMYKMSYSIRNFYTDHKFVVYLPIFVILGLILGISSAVSHETAITNFIDGLSEESYSYGLVFMRELFLFVLVACVSLLPLVSKYFHILGVMTLLLVGYRFGHTIGGLVIGNAMTGSITIIIINIPFVLIATCVICVMYALISCAGNIYCIGRTGRANYIIRYLLIWSLIYILLIVFFHIVIPKIIVLIFL